MIKARLAASALLILSLFPAEFAIAQPAAPGDAGLGMEGIDVGGDRKRISGRTGLGVFSGNARATQAGLDVRADRLAVWFQTQEEMLAEGRKTRRAKRLYAEGNVLVAHALGAMEADAFHLDIQSGRGVLARARATTLTPDWPNPLIVHAKLVWVLFSGSEDRAPRLDKLVARDAIITDCDFGVPHYGLEVGRASRRADGSIRIRSLVLRAGPVPLLYIPRISWAGWDIPLAHLKPGNSSRFGPFLESGWKIGRTEHLRNTLLLDGYEKRGLGTGLLSQWSSASTQARLRAYRIIDSGRDRNDLVPEERDRWRVRAFSSTHGLPGDLELHAEYAQESDRGFLLEFFESEEKAYKEPETFVYLRHERPTSLAFAEAKVRRSPFRTQLETLPRAGWRGLRHRAAGLPGLGLPLYLEAEAEAGRFRLREDSAASPLHERFDIWRMTGSVRASTRAGAGAWGFNPYLEAQGGIWEQDTTGRKHPDLGAVGGGFSIDTVYSRLYGGPGESALRHVFAPRLAWDRLNEARSPDGPLWPIDSFEQTAAAEAFRLSARNLVQARRPWGILELLDLGLAVRYYPRPARDNAGEDWGPLLGDLRVNPERAWQFRWETAYDLGLKRLERSRWTAVARPLPVLGVSASVSINRKVSETAAGGVDWTPSGRWSVRANHNYDLQAFQWSRQDVTVRRFFHRWVLEIGYRRDLGRREEAFFFQLAHSAAIPNEPLSYELRSW